MRKLILLIVIVFFTSSCTKKEFIIMVEQPSNNMLDKLKVEIDIDKKKVGDINLKATNITPSYITTEFLTSKEGKHILEIKLKDTVFSYQIYYPEEKYIIVSPYLEKSGKVNIGILKQKDKFVFQ